jgi:hypothetical protein
MFHSPKFKGTWNGEWAKEEWETRRQGEGEKRRCGEKEI